MRLILFMATLLPAVALCQAKRSIPVFGKIEKTDLQKNSCDFDPNAEAMVLYESGVLLFDMNTSGSYRQLQHFVRIKILNQDGLKWADVKLKYESRRNAEGIVGLTANTYNLDESGNVVVTKLDKKLIYQRKINGRFSEEVFTMPEVKVGSVVEYKYSWRGYGYRNWFLQKTIPVKLSHFELNFPSQFEVHNRALCTLPYESKDESSSLRTIKTVNMENIPALHNEEYTSCNNDYLQQIESWVVAYQSEGKRYPLIKTWTEISKAMMEDEDFGLQLKKEIPRTAELDAEMKNLNDPYRKMLAVYDYVRKNMKWDGTDNFWALSGVKSAWKEKSGTSGEINLILINLLRDAGIKVHPIMVSTRENGRVSIAFPNIEQFNKVMAYVNIAGKNYVLDGTDKYTPAALIPENVMFTEGLVLDPSNEYRFRWQQLWDDSRVSKNIVIYQAIINDGEMKGHATVTSMDYARMQRIPALADRQAYLNRFMDLKTTRYLVDSLKLQNEETDSLPLVQEFNFHGPVNASGGYNYFSTNLFAGMSANPFIADTRFSDVVFGTNQFNTIISNILIPEGFTFEELPKNTRLTLEDRSLVVTRMNSVSGNILNTRITVEFKKPYYSTEEYPDLKEFYKKMYSLLDEQIVIKKKENM